MTPETRQNVVRAAEVWLGTPYHHRAAIRGVGVDCARFLIEVFADAGLIERFDPGEYSPQWHMNQNEEIFQDWLRQYADPVERPLLGDVGIWKWGRCFSHGSILVRPNTVIHAYLRRPVGYTDLDEQPLSGREVRWWSVR